MFGSLKRFIAKFRNPASRSQAWRGYLQVAVGYVRFGWGWWTPRERVTYRAYVPDSVWVFDRHRQISGLVEKWQRGNHRNNGGDFGRFYALALNLKQILDDGVAGDFAELGVYRGNSAAVLADFAARHGRRVLLFDTFGGFDSRDLTGLDERADFHGWFSDTSLAYVKRTVGHPESCLYVPGYFPESLTPECDRTYAFVHIDCDLYKPMKAAMEFFYSRLSAAGCLFLHDYGSGPWEGATRAIDEFCAATGTTLVLLPDKSGTAVLRKPGRPPGAGRR